MKELIQTGATVEEAISIALKKLGCTRDDVQIEVLQEEKKGFLGFGTRDAEVKLTLIKDESKEDEEIQEQVLEVEASKDVVEKEQTQIEAAKEVDEAPETNEEETAQEETEVDPVEIAYNYLNDVAKSLGIDDLKMTSEVDGKYIYINLESEKAALLIGKRGATLNAIQHLTQLVMNKASQSFQILSLDVENYRERRQASLEQLAEKMADKAVHTGRKVSLEPMPSYERKIIHNALANRVDIETYSEGVEPNRHLVIEPIK